MKLHKTFMAVVVGVAHQIPVLCSSAYRGMKPSYVSAILALHEFTQHTCDRARLSMWFVLLHRSGSTLQRDSAAFAGLMHVLVHPLSVVTPLSGSEIAISRMCPGLQART